MAAKSPGLPQLDAFVDVLVNEGIEAASGKEQYRVASTLLIAAYEIYADQFARKTRSDKVEETEATE